MSRVVWAAICAGCAASPHGTGPIGTTPPSSDGPATSAPPVPGTDTASSRSAEPPPLEITFLGVGGYLLRYDGQAVMTPPMYSNPDLIATTLGTIRSDPAVVDRFTAEVSFADVAAILVGHGHYDHLLDAPTLWPRTAGATFYGNATVRHLLAAFAPDPAPYCEDVAPPAVVIPRDHVVQLDDPQGELGQDLVDWRMCPAAAPPGGGDGAWIGVPGAPIRLRALCSMHPDQVGPIHFAPGSLYADACEPPPRADDWLEGQTLAFLIDFLDAQGRPVHRVYYQDAPTAVPVGLFSPSLLEERGVDVALLNVGSYTAVPDQPAATVALMAPRYVIGGHWEDFFRQRDRPTVPIIGHDVDAWAADAVAAMPPVAGGPVEVDGAITTERVWVPEPGTGFRFWP